MNEQPIAMQQCLASLPQPWPEDPLPAIRKEIRSAGVKLVVLDDDPTGTQTVHDVPIYTEWSVEALQAALLEDAAAVFILTNSRSLARAEAEMLNRQIGGNLTEAARLTGSDFEVVSRSDSTLRGHFPAEMDALAEAMGEEFDAWLVIPFFAAGGRLTIGDVHYVAEGDWLAPAGQTPFARDRVFGYRSSNLREWVEEKTAGRIRADEVASISLDVIRRGGPDRVARLLLDLSRRSVCVVNAACQRDVEVVAQGLLAARSQPKRYLYRTAASFVQARAGIEPKPLLRGDELQLPQTGGGLIIFGSYVPKSTEQLTHLLKHIEVAGLEVAVEKLLDDRQRRKEIERVAKSAEGSLKRGQDTVIYTSRKLVTGADDHSSLSIHQRVSDALVTIVQSISPLPRYILTKGGITSSDIATKACSVKRAIVLGQILPGVPVWRLGSESRYRDMPQIVFPGNVGGPDAVTKIVNALRL